MGPATSPFPLLPARIRVPHGLLFPFVMSRAWLTNLRPDVSPLVPWGSLGLAPSGADASTCRGPACPPHSQPHSSLPQAPCRKTMCRLPTLSAADPAILGLTGSPPGGVEMACKAQSAETSLKTSCRVPLPSPIWAALSPTKTSDRARLECWVCH